MIPNPWIIAGFLIALIGSNLATGKLLYDFGYTAADSKHIEANAEADKQAQDAAKISWQLAIEREKALRIEKDKVEKENADALAKINGLRIANGRLVAAHGGLYDKNGRPNPVSGNNLSANSDTTSGVDGSPTGCRLSEQLSDFLQSRFYDADIAANYANTCRAWVLSIGQ